MKIESMVIDPVVNFGKVTISTGYISSDLVIGLNIGEGSKLPNPSIDGPFNLVWYNSTDYPDPSDDPFVEIVRCTSRIGDTLTITRGQEGTLASNKNISGKTYKMTLSPTKKTITDIQTDISASVKKSGDTMTGTLNLPLNGLVVGTNQLIVSGGNVGIGTISPGTKLGITGSGFTEISLYSGDNSYARIWYGTGGSYATAGSSWNVGIRNDSGYNNAFAIESNAGPGWVPKLFITQGGNVGIGTTTPGYRGDISGSFRVGGASQPGATSGYGIEFHAGTTRSQIYAYNRDIASPIDISLQEAGGNVILFGNVGIGTTSPGAKLDIFNTGGNTNLRLIGDVAQQQGIEYRDSVQRWVIYKPPSTTDLRFWDGGADRVTIRNGGNVGIGISPTYQLQLSLDSAAKPGTNTWTISSDERIKKDIRLFTDGIETILNINPVWYKYNGKAGFKDDNEDHIGVIGQEIRDVAPYTINTYKAKLNEDDKEETELLNFNSHALTFVLINAIKEMNIKIQNFSTDNDKLKNEIETLRNEIVDIKRQHTQ